jgi:predicted O-methyltransferase YrrM
MGRYPAGHYYSPVPSEADVDRHLRARDKADVALPGIDYRPVAQRELLEHYAAYYRDLPFQETAHDGLRYHFGQEWFRYADAIFLYAHLRHTQPRTIVEVGSGWSTAVMLDTIERSLHAPVRVICVEPDPDRLRSLLRPGDAQVLQVIQEPVQLADPSVFAQLEPGDLLFIDSSHVLKAGSDLYHLLFGVLPVLPSGVFVHFHDIFSDFDYPDDWLRMGRSWNEAYLLRAFLCHSSCWRIHFFNAWIGRVHRDWLTERMPLCLKDTGGGLYIVQGTPDQ